MPAPILWYTLCWAHHFGETLGGATVADAVSARFELAEARRLVRVHWREVQGSLGKGDLR